MGIYIIKSLHSEWIKIGHHKVTDRRPSVYYRYINRGFISCICPEEIENKVNFSDLQLLYWFPNLNIKDETNLHSQLKSSFIYKGEWYKYNKLDDILAIIYKDYNGILEMPNEDDYNRAKLWCNKIK